jgi:hypothetical protein
MARSGLAGKLSSKAGPWKKPWLATVVDAAVAARVDDLAVDQATGVVETEVAIAVQEAGART